MGRAKGSASDAIAAIRALCDGTPELLSILHAILDTREQRGRLPGTLTVTGTPSCVPVLCELLSARAVKDRGNGKLRLDLGAAGERALAQVGLPLDQLLYQALERQERDPLAERAALCTELAGALQVLEATSAAARSFLAAEAAAAAAAAGESHRLAHDRWAGGAPPAQAVGAAVAEARAIAACMDAAVHNRTPTRLRNFAARVLGGSKQLDERSDRYRRLCEALLVHDPAIAEDVATSGIIVSMRAAHRAALEVRGIFRDQSTITVHCFGPLVYGKRGARFDHVAAHGALGDTVPLSLQQLRDLEIIDMPVERVVVIENHTPFLDYVEALVQHGRQMRELVVCASGQCNWAVVTLMSHVGRYLRRARPGGVRLWHAGDLDRSGVLILRSLARRAAVELRPLGMSVDIHRRFASRGIPVSADERARLQALLASEDRGAAGHELLHEVVRTGLWIEQEALAHEVLVTAAKHGTDQVA